MKQTETEVLAIDNYVFTVFTCLPHCSTDILIDTKVSRTIPQMTTVKASAVKRAGQGRSFAGMMPDINLNSSVSRTEPGHVVWMNECMYRHGRTLDLTQVLLSTRLSLACALTVRSDNVSATPVVKILRAEDWAHLQPHPDFRGSFSATLEKSPKQKRKFWKF